MVSLLNSSSLWRVSCLDFFVLESTLCLQINYSNSPLVIHICLIVSRLNNWKLGQVLAALISLVISLISIIEI